MSDLSIPSSTGLVLNTHQVYTGVTLGTEEDPIQYSFNGTNDFTGYAHRPVPGQLLQTNGIGQFEIEHIGVRGSMTAEVITGPVGLARAIIKVTSELTSPPRDTLQISLDSSNRPVLTIAYSGASIIKISAPGGDPIPEGAYVGVRVVWDSITPLASGNHVDFTLLNGAPVPGDMGDIPTAPWPTAYKRYVRIGYGAQLYDFNGTILNLQVGDQRM